MDIPDTLRARILRPVALFGDGVSGRAAAALLRRQGISYRVYDERSTVAGVGCFDERAARAHDLVVFSPGFPPDHPWLDLARLHGALCLGETDFGSLYWRGAIIAITGTNGKTTLTDFLTRCLIKEGVSAVAAGNIGVPLSTAAGEFPGRDSMAVCEVSSFQAESMEHFKAHALLWTNFAEDHLDRYADIKAYFMAKYRLVERLVRPRLIVGVSVVAYAKRLGCPLPAYTQVVDVDRESHRLPDETVFATLPQAENYLVALRYWEQEGFDPATLETVARGYRPPAHRLAVVDKINGVTYWNDSKATNFSAALSALNGFSGKVIWIAGGKSKGGDIDAFVEAAVPKLRHAFLIGQTAPLIAEKLAALGVPCRTCETLESAVEHAAVLAKSGESVVFSPGFASFDMFNHFGDRGIRFQEAVFRLKNAT
jgi:UDP-N-acetylmuramoylalanine--D-glutamate ligase